MIAILVPVLGRAHQIKPLLQSIGYATQSPHRVVLICSPRDDALSEAKSSKAEVIVVGWLPGKADYAKKINLGFDSCDEPWVFQAATDLRFHFGWDLHALKAAARFRRGGVIGTNDLGNPLVMRGQHSTHSLISRDYITTHGGTVDGTGTVFSEAYDHQYTDSEFIETARRRRQFVFARRAIVEHLHPHWGKGEHDETYTKALRRTKQDQLLFMDRRRMVVKRA